MASQVERALLVRAAGVLPWREIDGGLQVALVHRPRYDDWSWPKGKLDPGEDWATCAAREAWEETGLSVRLGPPLPTSWYGLGDRGGRPTLKQVRYWAATVAGGTGTLENEVDQVRWLGTEQARNQLTYGRDREQLDALTAAYTAGTLQTWNLLVVRHARAIPRGQWDQPDPERPLHPVGVQRAGALVPLLHAYEPQHLLSSPSVRCADTLIPYASASGTELVTRQGLSEEGHAAHPAKAVSHLTKVLKRAESTALCSHGPVLPGVLTTLADHATGSLSRVLHQLADRGMDKGEVLAVQLTGHGPGAVVRHLERHRPTG